jgi:hypothetical protein
MPVQVAEMELASRRQKGFASSFKQLKYMMNLREKDARPQFALHSGGR